MSNSKVIFTHQHEEKIALYCAKNNLNFDQTTAYDLILKAFESDPIIVIAQDQNDEEKKFDVTPKLARSIEFQPKTIERIAAKSILYREKELQNSYRTNIQKAKISEAPDLDKLVDNLYRLNIVDKESYLSFVCFLMQLKYTRDHEIEEDDKTCVFFNGVARNGKSATAKAICEVESQYGKVFKPQSGKILEATHEEQVWQSHLNYFDEVR